MWIDPIAVQENQEGELILTCPNAFSCRRIQEHYGTLIRQEVARRCGKACRFTSANGHKPTPEIMPAGGSCRPAASS